MQRHGFHTPLGRIFPLEGIFPMELTWILTPFPQNSFGWEYKPRSSLWTHALHYMDSKDLTCPTWMNASDNNTPSMHYARRWNVTTSMVGLRNGHIRKSLTQNGEPQRSSWGTLEKKNGEPQRSCWETHKKKKNGEPQRSCWGTQKRKKNTQTDKHF